MPPIGVPNKTNGQPQAKSTLSLLTNRGGAGMRDKLTEEQRKVLEEHQEPRPAAPKLTQARARYRIVPALHHLAVPIDSLVPDPDNAKEHPEENLEAIKESLLSFGQIKPIVVQSNTRIVLAGNGTLSCAKALGWTEIAATLVDMNEAEATGYAIADNKTSELGRWNWEALKRAQRLLEDAGQNMIGWSDDMILVLRASEWIPPKVSGFDDTAKPLTIKIPGDKREPVDEVIKRIRARRDSTDHVRLNIDVSVDHCIVTVCREWLRDRGVVLDDDVPF